MPSEIKQASEKWKDALLTQFPSPRKKTDESGVIEEADLSSFLDGLINAHVSVYVTGLQYLVIQQNSQTMLLPDFSELFAEIPNRLKGNNLTEAGICVFEIQTVFESYFKGA